MLSTTVQTAGYGVHPMFANQKNQKAWQLQSRCEVIQKQAFNRLAKMNEANGDNQTRFQE